MWKQVISIEDVQKLLEQNMVINNQVNLVNDVYTQKTELNTVKRMA